MPAINEPTPASLVLHVEDDHAIRETVEMILAGETDAELRQAPDAMQMLGLIDAAAAERAQLNDEQARALGQRTLLLLDLRFPLGGSPEALAAAYPDLLSSPEISDLFPAEDAQQPPATQGPAQAFRCAKLVLRHAITMLGPTGLSVVIASANAAEFESNRDTVIPQPQPGDATYALGRLDKPFDIDTLIEYVNALTAPDPNLATSSQASDSPSGSQ